MLYYENGINYNFRHCLFVKDDEILTAFLGIKTIFYKGVYYYNAPCSFDIETSSFYDHGEKCALMYVWQMDLNGLVFYGRYWEEFTQTLERIKRVLNLNMKKRLIIYVHNLSYEFQFMHPYLQIDKIFAREARKVIYVDCNNSITFKCSYFLSGYSLAKVAADLLNHKISKLVGDLDYSKIRTPETPLEPDEMHYMLNDVLAVEYYISEQIAQNDGKITRIPLTQTGYVRREVRKACYPKKDVDFAVAYGRLMEALRLNNADEYEMLKAAFQGGFTHTNALYSGQVVEQVRSVDFTSSYPAVILSEKFPMSKGKFVTVASKEEFQEYIENYCCIFEIELYNIVSQFPYENIISKSKCRNIENGIFNNGRVYSADYLETTITEIDYKCYQQFYSWDDFHIKRMIIYERGYLPKSIIDTTYNIYAQKTELKGIPDKEAEYMHAKQLLNSIYGMMVTDIINEDITFNEHKWGVADSDVDKIAVYNYSRNRFLFYPWGIYVTAYARRNLYTGILELKGDYLYSDTDSLKYTYREDHNKYFKSYNQNILKKLKAVCKWYKLPTARISPKTVKGIEKPIGVWDDDGDYARFKSLGAKRYMVEDENGIYHLTCAGVSKQGGIRYLQDHYTDPFDGFTDDLIISGDYSGRKILTYIDTPMQGTVTDYLGNEYHYNVLSCIHMENSDYHLSLANEYLYFIASLRGNQYVNSN